jgi:hypothetical protein
MGALVNVFKSLLGGILGFFGGLVGGKKGKKDKDGFYMVADDASMEELPAAAPVMAAAVSAAAVSAAPEAKAGKGKKDKAVKAAPMQAAAKVARVMTPEELIVAAVQAKPVDATAVAAAGGTAGFATQYLVPTLTSGRRSPGPSLKMFKTMAKEIRG